MDKPREFWTDGNIIFDDKELANEICIDPKPIHVREVVPIDWEKVWREIDRRWPNLLNGIYEDAIQQLVEKQLAGEE